MEWNCKMNASKTMAKRFEKTSIKLQFDIDTRQWNAYELSISMHWAATHRPKPIYNNLREHQASLHSYSHDLMLWYNTTNISDYSLSVCHFLATNTNQIEHQQWGKSVNILPTSSRIGDKNERLGLIFCRYIKDLFVSIASVLYSYRTLINSQNHKQAKFTMVMGQIQNLKCFNTRWVYWPYQTRHRKKFV